MAHLVLQPRPMSYCAVELLAGVERGIGGAQMVREFCTCLPQISFTFYCGSDLSLGHCLLAHQFLRHQLHLPIQESSRGTGHLTQYSAIPKLVPAIHCVCCPLLHDSHGVHWWIHCLLAWELVRCDFPVLVHYNRCISDPLFWMEALPQNEILEAGGSGPCQWSGGN